MPANELIKTLRVGAQGLDNTVRFLILDACDRLERQIRDNELLMQKIVELRSRTVKTNADRIRAMSDEELARFLAEIEWECNTYDDCAECPRMTDDGCVSLSRWLKQPAEGE